MSASFDFERVNRVTVGSLGEPGKRTFYLQLRQGREIISLILEKDQLRVLTERLHELLPGSTLAAGRSHDMSLEQPLEAAWRVGRMTLAYDEEEKLFDISLVELAPEGQQAATGHFEATVEQMQALAGHAVAVVAAGRPPCPMCGGPIDHDGGVCPRLNGHH
jgi:uncharacterized repeat protein (TIGR03847 family)